MEDKIKAYASLKFHIDHPKIRFNDTKLKGEIAEGQTLLGDFSIESVNGVPITGNVEVFDHRIELLSGDFKTTSFNVTFKVHAESAKADDVISGSFHVLTNGGEFDVYYEYKIVERCFETAGGIIHNLKEFADFAQINYDEAVREFYTDDFVNVLLYGDEHISDRRMYRSLIKSVSHEQALEEFLITLGLKNKVSFSSPRNEAAIKYDKEDVSKDITINKTSWGFVDADVYCDDKAVFLPKKHISRDDFLGKEMKLPVVISIDALAEPEYDIPIRVVSVYDSLEIKLKVRRKTRSRSKKSTVSAMFSNTSLKKTYQAQLVKDYINYRAGKLPLQEYTNRSIECANELIRLTEGLHWYRLIRLHMYIMKKDRVRVLQEMENIETHEEMMLKDKFSECYYAYLKALYSSEDEDIDYAIEVVSQAYDEDPSDFRFFFMLSYLDPDLIDDRNSVYIELERLYDEGVNSPFLYFEACDLYNEYPHILREFTDFALQTLNWSYRRGDLTKDVIARVIELVKEKMTYKPKLYRFLRAVYFDDPSDDLLYIICALLIKSNRCDKEAYEFYSRGVDKSFKLIGLMECYLRSIDTSDYPVLPKSVVLYFSYSEERLNEQMLAYLYANIAINRQAYGATYNEYEDSIYAFVIDQVNKGNTSEHLSVLYKDYLTDSHIIANVANALPNILFMNRFSCDNPNIVSVIVEHDECGRVETAVVNDGVAYLDCVTSNAGITLVDNYNRRYIGSIDYSLEPLFDDERYIPYCYQANQNSLKLLLRLADIGWRLGDVDYEMVKVLKALLQFDDIRDDYRKKLNAAILDYYYDQYEGDIFEEYLKELSLESLDVDNRAVAIDYMVERQMYDRAYEAVKELGFHRLSDEHMKELASYEVEKDDTESDDLLIGMCYELFHRDLYTESILKYLIEYAKGGNQELVAIYQVAKNNHIDTFDLEERIVIQSIMVDCYDDVMLNVFANYLNSNGERHVYLAYANALAYRYFIMSVPISDEVIEILIACYKRGILNNELGYAALMKAYSERIDRAKEDKEIISTIMAEFVKNDMLFPFFKQFDSILSIPKECYVKSFLIYKGAALDNVEVHYSKRGLRVKEARTERMREYFSGYYVKDFVLFDDEDIDYYITATKDDEVIRIEKDEISFIRPKQSKEKSAFSLVNKMIGLDYTDDSLYEQMDEYIKNKYLLDENMILL
ncbi:MAG: DUF5717 family protein [Lachnospiraceae bacterium]|nr:DUF5717 family protein [Lachnospiraceae bacterium]